jgi:serine/threonine-protein kinase RsbW
MQNTKHDIITMTIPASPKYIAVARLMLSGIASGMNFDFQDIEDIKVAVSEALNNVIQHAYKNRKSKNITMICRNYKNKIEIQVIDSGCGFNYKAHTGKGQLKQFKITDKKLGCGIYLMKSLMDEVAFTSNKPRGTIVRMIKSI